MKNKINRAEKIYNILCDTYGEEAINFFTDTLGMELLDTEQMQNAVIDNGLAEQYEFDDNFMSEENDCKYDTYDYE